MAHAIATQRIKTRRVTHVNETPRNDFARGRTLIVQRAPREKEEEMGGATGWRGLLRRRQRLSGWSHRTRRRQHRRLQPWRH